MNQTSLQQANQWLTEEVRHLKTEQETHLKLINEKDSELQIKDSELQTKAQELEAQKRYNRELMELLAQFRRQRFGSSSEQVNPNQLELFNEAEDDIETVETNQEVPTQVRAHQRKKTGRAPLPAHLPREDIIHDLADVDKVCPHDGTALELIGDDRSEQLDIVPAQIKVIRHIRNKYACPCCKTHIVTASKPKQPIEKSMASAGLLAYIITSKYQDSLPLYRQQAMFKRIGVELQRHTLANWMIQCGQLIQPLINAISERIREQSVIHIDETTVQVLKAEPHQAQKKRYMWVQRAGPPNGDNHYVLFHYADSRSGTVATELLEGYQGAIMADGYSGYNQLNSNDITRLGCWAHARRKFYEAKQAQPKGKTGKADQALAWIQKLYAIEKQLNGLTNEPERRAYRQQYAKPIINKMNAWKDKSLLNITPQSALGKALTYLTNQWKYLVTYMEHGDYPIDNNLAENAIRPFVVGRKNWLFSNSTNGAEASANLYSLIETAKAQQVEPYHYLRWVLAKVARATNHRTGRCFVA